MAAGDIARIIRASGKIVIDPTDLTAADPYGGTEVGKTMGCAVVPLMSDPKRIMSESHGEASDIIEPMKRIQFACRLRGWDDDAVNKLLFGGYTAGSTSQHAHWDEPGAAVAGATALGRARKVLYVPDDLLHVQAVLVYAGVSFWQSGAEIPFSRSQEMTLPLVIEGFRDSNNNILAMGLLADLSLT